jgi:TrmH family RNA methyltransferase
VDIISEFRNARRSDELVVLEGFHALKHAMRFGARILQAVAVDPEALEVLAANLAPDLAGRFITTAQKIPAAQFRELGKNLPHTEVMAIALRPTTDAWAILQDSSPKSLILLEDPRNLGNIGAAIRVAAAADAGGVITTGRNDPWDPMVIRGSAGLHFALPVARVHSLREITESGRPLVALDPEGESMNLSEIPSRAILAFGTERHGLSNEILMEVDMKISIPMRPGVSSLNLATSVAVVLFGARRNPAM